MKTTTKKRGPSAVLASRTSDATTKPAHCASSQRIGVRTTEQPSIILNLTRCCTEECRHCAVSAIYGQGVTKCAQLAARQVRAGRELGVEEWTKAIDRLMRDAPSAKFDLSGGDCLALPWVRQTLVPWMVKRSRPDQVAITAPAASLKVWLDEIERSRSHALPGSVHFTLDGHSRYSNENLSTAQQIRRYGMDVHAECPISTANTSEKAITRIYRSAATAGISEITLIRYFPVGRGYRSGARLEPQPEQYQAAARMWQAIQTDKGPRVKLQCSLKTQVDGRMSHHCKLGPRAWCAMPDGTMLSCPWAYGEGGKPLHPDFVIGNITTSSFSDLCHSSAVSRGRVYAGGNGDCGVIRYARRVRSATAVPA